MKETKYKFTVGGLSTVGTKEELLALLKDDLENFHGKIIIERVIDDEDNTRDV